MITFLKENDNCFRIACAAGREILFTGIKNGKFTEGFLTKFNDWISSVKYLDDNTIAAITAHNIAMLLSIENKKAVIEEKIKSKENSTLYCSHIHGTRWTDLIFFSGTALGELIIWNTKGETLYQKSTHNGVIFSINYVDNFIVTGSDDRSIKIYKVDKDFSQLIQLKQLFGHTSRVFVGKVIKYKSEFMFLSAGEDSNLCIWKENGTLMCKKNISASGCIWDLDYDSQNAVIVTSSSTGKLNKFQLDKMLFESHKTQVISEIENVEPARLLYLDNGTLCVLDNKMQIHTKKKNEQIWQKSVQLDNSRKVVAMQSFENRLVLAAKSSILIFDYSNPLDRLIFTLELDVNEKFSSSLPAQHKLNYFRAIHVLSLNEIFISDIFGSCVLIDIETEKVKNIFKIPKSNEPWSTSVAKIDDYWIIADRVGSLFLYDNCENDFSKFHLPVQKLCKVHGQIGVTTISILPDDFLRTTGNDGTIKTLRLNRNSSRLEFHQVERTSHVHFIENIKTYNGKSYVHGFNDNYFVLYKDREIIYEHRCGGRHRHWDVTLINADDLKMQFSYIYKKQVHSVEFYLTDSIFDIRNDIHWHTKQCNALRVIDDMNMLITGSEDTVLKLMRFKVIDGEFLFTKIADIYSHISSIKSIQTWTEGNDLCIISLGGRAQIVMTRVINRTYVKEEINFMLTNSLDCGHFKESTFDPETRFTCAYYDANERRLFVGCSDGYLRVFKLVHNEFSSSLKPLIECFYGRCILNITAIKSFILTMATDGIVCFWSLDVSEALLQPTVVYKLHHNQNGINSFDVLELDIDRYSITTAGDDNSIYVTEFRIIDNRTIKCYKTIKSHGIHIAQVTGIKFIAHDVLLTASVDQKICKVRIKESQLELMDERATCISDVKGFSIFDERFILVHGAGLEAIDYF